MKHPALWGSLRSRFEGSRLRRMLALDGGGIRGWCADAGHPEENRGSRRTSSRILRLYRRHEYRRHHRRRSRPRDERG